MLTLQMGAYGEGAAVFADLHELSLPGAGLWMRGKYLGRSARASGGALAGP